MPRRTAAPSRTLSTAAALLLLLPLLAALAPADALELADAPAPTALPRFDEVTALAGLGAFRHAGYLGPGNFEDPGAIFTEITGPGACWLDYDADGWLDLYLVNGLYQSDPALNAALDPHSMLYRNLGDGTFADATAATGARVGGLGQGCAAADYDDDGYTDMYVTGFGGSTLFRNRGDGTFANVTAAMGVGDADCADGFQCWASSASWWDYDRDGCLDLYVGHFEEMDQANPPATNGPTVGQVSRLFRGACGGAFTETTAAAGLTEKKNHWSSAAADYNGDGWPDLYVSNDGDPNDLYLNDGDGTFTRKSPTVAENEARSGMGTAVGDLNGDGLWDMVSTNFQGSYNGIFRAEAGDYVDLGGTPPFDDALPHVGWATHFTDLDNDGLPDLMVINGHTEDLGFAAVKQPILAYHQLPDGSYESVRTQLGADFQGDFVGRGGAWADYDNDGSEDFLLAEAGDNPTHLFHAARTSGTFLTLDLVGDAVTGTRDASGARVRVDAQGLATQWREKILTSGFLGNNDPRLHFGLGAAQTADVTVTWPDGATQSWSGLRANSFLRLTQGQAQATVLRELPFVSLGGPAEAAYGVPVTFTATATGGAQLASATWTFPDGSTASGASATHAFRDVGDFIVQATVTDDQGRSKGAALAIHIVDALQAAVEPAKPVFHPFEPARFDVVVRFSDGQPVPDALVHIAAVHTSGDAAFDAAAGQLPFFAQELLGYRTFEAEGATDAAGRVTFTLPYGIQPSDLVPFGMSHPGRESVTATGGARGSTFDPASAGFDIGIPDPGL